MNNLNVFEGKEEHRNDEIKTEGNETRTGGYGKIRNFRNEEIVAAAATAKSLQSCLTLCDPIDGSPSGSPIPGILQARTLEWVTVSFSNEIITTHHKMFN